MEQLDESQAVDEEEEVDQQPPMQRRRRRRQSMLRVGPMRRTTLEVAQPDGWREREAARARPAPKVGKGTTRARVALTRSRGGREPRSVWQGRRRRRRRRRRRSTWRPRRRRQRNGVSNGGRSGTPDVEALSQHRRHRRHRHHPAVRLTRFAPALEEEEEEVEKRGRGKGSTAEGVEEDPARRAERKRKRERKKRRTRWRWRWRRQDGDC